MRGLARIRCGRRVGRLLSDSGFPSCRGACRSPVERIEDDGVFAAVLARSGASSARWHKLSRVAREVEGQRPHAGNRRPNLEAVGLSTSATSGTTRTSICVSPCTSAGRKVFYIAGAEVLHYRGKSAARNPEMERLRQRSHVAYYEKHLPMWTPLLRLYSKSRARADTDADASMRAASRLRHRHVHSQIMIELRGRSETEYVVLCRPDE